MEMWCPDDIGRDSWDWVGPPAWARACFNSPEWGGVSSPVKTEPLQIVLLLLLLLCYCVIVLLCCCCCCVVVLLCCVLLCCVLCVVVLCVVCCVLCVVVCCCVLCVVVCCVLCVVACCVLLRCCVVVLLCLVSCVLCLVSCVLCVVCKIDEPATSMPTQLYDLIGNPGAESPGSTTLGDSGTRLHGTIGSRQGVRRL